MRDPNYSRHIGVEDSGWDCALELTIRDGDRLEEVQTIRIPVEDIPTFLADVVRHGTQALRTAARRLEVGHCETCANTGLIDEEQHGRMAKVICPDCRHRWPSEPFANAPKIGYLDR